MQVYRDSINPPAEKWQPISKEDRLLLPGYGIEVPTRGHGTLRDGMIEGARYVHTNLIAQDWSALARFYQSVFGCEVVPPIRDFPASAVEAGTGVPAASLSGVHLRLPGHDAAGPTIEIFTYSTQLARPALAANRPGFAHIAFAVASVADARAEVLAAGGQSVGEIVTVTTASGTQITWCYVADPEGNIIELQATS